MTVLADSIGTADVLHPDNGDIFVGPNFFRKLNFFGYLLSSNRAYQSENRKGF